MRQNKMLKHIDKVKKYMAVRLYVMLLACLMAYYFFKSMYEIAFMLAVLLIVYQQMKNNFKREIFEND